MLSAIIDIRLKVKYRRYAGTRRAAKRGGAATGDEDITDQGIRSAASAATQAVVVNAAATISRLQHGILLSLCMQMAHSRRISRHAVCLSRRRRILVVRTVTSVRSTLMWVLRSGSPEFATSSTADCDVVPGADEEWIVTVSQGGSVLVSEQCTSCAAATQRAEELREMFLQQQWTDLPPRDHRWRPVDRTR
jgi:hypothetical protein